METNQINIKKIGFFIIKKLHYNILFPIKKDSNCCKSIWKKTTNIY